ncbi:MAG: hypothetical protein NT040_04605 [Bacteroidetes bacterium]|nr:hypothetical protein [Bacteroidota bacterium]
MKTINRLALLFISMFFAFSIVAAKAIPPGMLGVHVVFSAKAYWDGPSKSCIPREKGGCCHIWAEGMEPGPGEIFGEMVVLNDKIIRMTVSRGRGMTNETYGKYFSDGKFHLDGPMTFDPNVLSRLGIEGKYMIPPGTYPCTANGDMLTIIFK